MASRVDAARVAKDSWPLPLATDRCQNSFHVWSLLLTCLSPASVLEEVEEEEGQPRSSKAEVAGIIKSLTRRDVKCCALAQAKDPEGIDSESPFAAFSPVAAVAAVTGAGFSSKSNGVSVKRKVEAFSDEEDDDVATRDNRETGAILDGEAAGRTAASHP